VGRHPVGVQLHVSYFVSQEARPFALGHVVPNDNRLHSREQHCIRLVKTRRIGRERVDGQPVVLQAGFDKLS
jgi:hypothetical protein